MIKRLKSENARLENCARVLEQRRIMNLQKLNELKRMDGPGGTTSPKREEPADEIITIDSDDE